MNPYFRTSCIVCGGSALYYLFSVESYRIVRCRDCDLLMTNPQPTDQDLARIYGEHYFLGEADTGAGHVDELKQATADIYLDLLARYTGALGGNLLEIGSGHGDFLLRGAARGLQVTGVEYSAHACAVAREKLRADKATIICGEITDLPGEECYDIIALSDVIEHVRDPRAFLGTARRLLRPNGVLFVATPTLDSWSARLLRGRWMEFKPEHLFYFKSANLQTLLIDCGFGQIIEQPCRKALSYDYIASHFDRYPIAGISPFTRTIGHLLPRGFRRHPFKLVASGMVQLARKTEAAVRNRLSLVVPVYNEVETFKTAFERLLAKRIEGLGIEIVVVESNSTDGTRNLVLNYEKRDNVKIVLEDRPYGKGHAVRAGLKETTGNLIMIQDADLEYDLEDYDALLQPLLRGQAAFVLGARHGGSAWKMRQFNHQPVVAAILNLAHWFFTNLINVGFGARLRDPFTMYKVFRRDCLYGIRFECNRFDFDWEIVIKFLRKGYRPLEIPVNYRSRSFAEGKKVSFFRDPVTWLCIFFKLRFTDFDPLQEIERERAQEGVIRPGNEVSS